MKTIMQTFSKSVVSISNLLYGMDRRVQCDTVVADMNDGI